MSNLTPPSDPLLPIDRLAAIFCDTTNSYKFYWFIAILDRLRDTDNPVIPFDPLCRSMVNSVWYPLNYFKLSFGAADSFKSLADFMGSQYTIDTGANVCPAMEQVENQLDRRDYLKLIKRVGQLLRYVPYRFVRPFFEAETRSMKDASVNGSIRNWANAAGTHAPHRCIYHFAGDAIVINNCWKDYLMRHSEILRAFTYWHLAKFVQKNNPNVASISEKLFKPSQRNNLNVSKRAWQTFIGLNGGFPCIYSGIPIADILSIDHFIPGSYTVHDLNWNLVPVTKNVNSSKNDRLPSMAYLPAFAKLQYDFVRVLNHSGKFRNILEDYSTLFGMQIADLCASPYRDFETRIRETITPMAQIAANMGFKKDWTYG